MYYAHGKPLGLWLVSAIILIDGLGLIGAALQLVVSAPEEWAAIVTSAVLGSLLVFKAYKLWSFHRMAWLVVLLASAIGGITHTLEIARGHGEPTTWLAAVWAAATVLYLGHPKVRALFVHTNRVSGAPPSS